MTNIVKLESSTTKIWELYLCWASQPNDNKEISYSHSFKRHDKFG